MDSTAAAAPSKVSLPLLVVGSAAKRMLRSIDRSRPAQLPVDRQMNMFYGNTLGSCLNLKLIGMKCHTCFE